MQVERSLPTGTVTFLFTDVERSTRLLDELGAVRYAEALSEHRRILRDAVSHHGGVEIDTQGDAFFVAFSTAPGALAAAAEAQAELEQGPIRVRMGLHTGTPLVTDEGYVGADVHRAARIAAAGHGGQVLLSSSTAALVQGDPLRDLGEHRLKDLSAAERIYQVGDREFPRLNSLYRTKLPIPLTSFVGREADLENVAALLAREDVRVVTLTGAGGTGKTRLALRASAEMSERYADGVVWVGLAALREPQLVLPTVAAELEAGQDLVAHIGDKRMLLLLDNFEQVVEASRDVASLVGACRHLDVLVTSREPLHVAGEWVIAVPPLSEHDARSLFLERALAVRSDFAVGGEVVEICRRLDNLPLAIELAAARVTALSAPALFDRLDRRLPTLDRGPRDAPERQQTLRATIAWSYDLLTPYEQRLFARLAIFGGGCTFDMAEDVCDADFDTLASLVEKSLVRHREGRYWMLETIREFSEDELGRVGERDAISTRHVDYFVAFAEQALPHIGTSEEPIWIELLAREHDNLRAALAYSDGSPMQLRLGCALWRFWEKRGHHSEGRRWLRTALARRRGASPSHVSAALMGAATLARVQGDFDEAERLCIESIAVARSASERRCEMRAVGSLANIALARGNQARAAELLAETEALSRALGDENARAATIGNRAYLALNMGDFELAFALAGEALELSRKLGDPTNALTARLNLTLAARALGRQGAARDALVEAIHLARDIGHAAFLVDALITAAAMVVPDDAAAAAALLAVADRARRDLMLELEPVERNLRASVASQIREVLGSVETGDVAAVGELRAVLDAGAVRALESLAKPQKRSSG